jgi:hypothetical protein
MLYREIIAGVSENNIKHRNTMLGQNLLSFSVEPGSI